MRELRLKTSLMLLMLLVVALTFSLVGGALLAFRLPQVEDRVRTQLLERARNSAQLLTHFMNAMEERITPLAKLAAGRSPAELQVYLDAIVGDGTSFESVFITDASGKVLAIGLPSRHRQAQVDLLGADLSQNLLFKTLRQVAARPNPSAIWSDKYLSALAGKPTVGVALAAGRYTIIGEASMDRILTMLTDAARNEESVISIIDSKGQWLASTNPLAPAKVRFFDFGAVPAFQSALKGEPAPKYVEVLENKLLLGTVLSDKLGWVIAATAPSGLGNYNYRVTLLLVLGGFVGSLLISIMLVPLWAAGMVRPLQALIARTHAVARGAYDDIWPKRGSTIELNQLSDDLQKMVQAIRSRERALQDSEQQLAAIFNASPTPMAVLKADANDEFRYLKVNHAWQRQFRRCSDDVLGRTGLEIGIWANPADRARYFAALVADPNSAITLECALLARDGEPLLCCVSSQIVMIGTDRLMLAAPLNITEQRSSEREIQRLNDELEQRVAQRTDQLSQANDELEAMVEHLKATQEQLVHTEKLAALGNMVAGIAHELNTPIGNGLLAVTALRDRLKEFEQFPTQTLSRNVLTQFLGGFDTGCDIAERNLHRAAELVSSFKQVAIDQTTSQRRTFLLEEVVGEILTALEPTLRRTPFDVTINVPPSLELDSYPGPLGQVLINLINNAVIHGLEGRTKGTIRITAAARASGRVEVSVEDDGKGIAPQRVGRIFEPFFTTRMGRGGSGLGLHVVHGIVTNVLGGTITVASREGLHTAFVMNLPQQAPLKGAP